MQGRQYKDVRSHLLPLWRASLRAIDDIKDSVREAGTFCVRVRCLIHSTGSPPLRLSCEYFQAFCC